MQLIARDGEIYAHLFENTRANLPRDLYWNISVELEPVALLGEQWDTSFQCEWLVWPITTLGDLDGMGLEQLRDSRLVEASLYLVSEHHPVGISHLVVRRTFDGIYQLDVQGDYDFEIDEQRLCGSFHFLCKLDFGGIIVVPENLSPKPSNSLEVAAAVAPFISQVGLQEPRQDGFRYILKASE